jgi:hypothetical protein
MADLEWFCGECMCFHTQEDSEECARRRLEREELLELTNKIMAEIGWSERTIDG